MDISNKDCTFTGMDALLSSHYTPIASPFKCKRNPFLVPIKFRQIKTFNWWNEEIKKGEREYIEEQMSERWEIAKLSLSSLIGFSICSLCVHVCVYYYYYDYCLDADAAKVQILSTTFSKPNKNIHLLQYILA